MLKYVGQCLRAIYAFVIAFLGAIVTVLIGDTGFGDITAGQWISAILAGLLAFGGVYQITNIKPSSGG